MEFFKEIILRTGERVFVRNADVKDAKDFTDFINKLFKETRNFARGEGDEDVTEEMQLNYITKHKQSNNSLLLLVELDNEIIGHAHIEQKSNKIKMKHRSEFGIGILKEHWGKGIGKILMEVLINFAKTFNFEQIELVVIKSNERAITLYKNFGFEEYGTFKNSFKYPDGTYDDGIYMINFLKV